MPSERSSSAVSIVFDQRFDHPEGLSWDVRANRLLWVDIFVGLVLSHDLGPGDIQTWQVGRPVGSVAPRRAGGLVCAVREGFGLLTAQGELTLVTEQLRDTPYLQMNDGAVDARGRFWAGSTCLEPEAYPGAAALYCLDPASLRATKVLHGVNVSNGIGWSPDCHRCYYVDSATGRVDEFAFDADRGALGERKTLVEVEGVPDGLAVDTEGGIWVAICGGWEVRRYTPSGRLDRVVRLPGSQVTTCAFGGPDLSTLFIAVSAHGLDERSQQSEKAGFIFAFEPGVQGIPGHEFVG
jgi:sugar lactone lactonase YvrE